jgi:hypothetical protein
MLLKDCEQQRPDIWNSLQGAVMGGLKAREVAPRMEQVGRMSVPRYDYKEMPISSLDASSTDPAKQVPATQMGMATMLVVAAIFSGATVFTLMEFKRDHSLAAALTAIGMLATLQAIEFSVKRDNSRRRKLRGEYGLTAEPEDAFESSFGTGAPSSHCEQRLASSAMLAAIASLPVAIWGTWTAIFPALFMGLVWLRGASRLGQLRATLSAEAVAARVHALGKSAAPSPDASAARAVEPLPQTHTGSAPPLPAAAGPLVPEQPVAAHDLPPASPEISELLDRWVRRRARFRLVHWISLGALIGGYTLIVLAFWLVRAPRWSAGSDFIPFGLLFMLAATVVLFGYWWKNRDPEDESGNSRHGGFKVVIAIWRTFILLETPLVFTVMIDSARHDQAIQWHPYFVASVLLFLLLHWLGTEWAMARSMEAFPVPTPRRLVMLRVFGSPSFDDLITLIKPWQRAGLIEHLEGYDTVGTRSDVQDAVESGQVDRVLVKNLAEVQQQLAESSTAPDRALRFQRHAFQCTNATWREAILAMLDRCDMVVMDLSSLSVQNRGCAWELCQLLYRVPLNRVTLLVNDSTDLDCLRGILHKAAEHMPPDSPNRDHAPWQLVRIGGLRARQPGESFYDWKRRLDDRLDPMLLTSWLLSIARLPHDPEVTPEARAWPSIFSAGIPWARHPRWSWLVLLALSAALAFYRSRS